jgi:hypothetical protein
MRPRDHLDENLLRDFFRRRPIGQKAVRESEQSGRVALEQLSGRGRVSQAYPLEKAPVFRALRARLVSHVPSGTAIPETAKDGKGFAPAPGREEAGTAIRARSSNSSEKAGIPISPSTV